VEVGVGRKQIKFKDIEGGIGRNEGVKGERGENIFAQKRKSPRWKQMAPNLPSLSLPQKSPPPSSPVLPSCQALPY